MAEFENITGQVKYIPLLSFTQREILTILNAHRDENKRCWFVLMVPELKSKVDEVSRVGVDHR